MKLLKPTLCKLGLSCLTLISFCTAADAPGFKVSKKYPVPGNGGFDYIVFDSASNQLFVSHGSQVDVLDADRHQDFAHRGGLHGIPSGESIPVTTSIILRLRFHHYGRQPLPAMVRWTVTNRVQIRDDISMRPAHHKGPP